jgi:polyhydroxybutyrate depolymerase
MGKPPFVPGRAAGYGPRWCCLVSLLAVALSSCGGDDATTTSSTTVTAPGTTTTAPATTTTAPATDAARPYDVFAPTSYDGSAPTPLVLFLHGYSLSGAEAEAIFQVQPLAEQHGFLYVHPDGTRDEQGEQFWNATDGCCNPADLPVDDSGYLAGVIEEIRRDYNVDPRRIYVLGASNGGFMSYRMACDHADTIAAIVSIAGATYLDTSRCRPSEPVSVLEVHGTADEYIAYEGGTFIDEPFPSAHATVTTWAAYNGCDQLLAPSGERRDVEPSLPGAETAGSGFDGCPAGIAVELWTIEGAGHIFAFSPDFVPSLIDFLLTHPKP